MDLILLTNFGLVLQPIINRLIQYSFKSTKFSDRYLINKYIAITIAIFVLKYINFDLYTH